MVRKGNKKCHIQRVSSSREMGKNELPGTCIFDLEQRLEVAVAEFVLFSSNLGHSKERNEHTNKALQPASLLQSASKNSLSPSALAPT